MIKRENPGASLGEIGKRAGELWKALDDKSVSLFYCHGRKLYWESLFFPYYFVCCPEMELCVKLKCG